MITFKKITIRNFLSFGNKPISVNLDTNNTTLILGNNKDAGEGGYSRNGVGKSSIFQALVWCLYNEGINNIKQDDFINITNKNKMLVILELNVNGTDLVIERGRKPAICSVTKNGEPYTLSTSNDVDKNIVAILGMDYNLFLNSILLSNNVNGFMSMKGVEQKQFIENLLALHVLSDRAETLKSLAKDNAVEIKLEEQNRINILGNNDRVSKNIFDLEQKGIQWINETERKTRSLESELYKFMSIDIEQIKSQAKLKTELESKISQLNFTMSELSNRKTLELSKLESEHLKIYRTIEQEESDQIGMVPLPETFDDILVNINQIHQENLNYAKESFDHENQLVVDRKELLQTQENDIKEMEAVIKERKSELLRITKEHSSLNNGECFYCHQAYTSKEKLDHLHSSIDEINEQLSILEPEYKTIVTQRDDHKSLIKEIIENIEKKFKEQKISIEWTHKQSIDQYNLSVSKEKDKYNTAVTTIRNNYSRLKNKAKEEYKQNILTIEHAHTDLVKDTKRELDSSSLVLKEYNSSPHQDANIIQINIANLNASIDDLENSINPYVAQIELLKNSITNYSHDRIDDLTKIDEHYKILVKLLTDSKSFVRKNLIDRYIPFINQKIKFFLESMDSPHKVTINNDLTVSIEYMKQSMSYGNLSNGERLRVNFAVSMAIREFVEMSNSRMNILMIDELLDNGLDADGFYRVFHVLDKMKKSTFIISHRDELIPEVDQVLTVIKENGFSTVE